MSEKNESFLAVKAVEEREREHVRSGGSPRVFYHPGRSANCIFDGKRFNHQGVPKGYCLDVAAWEKAGREGAAPLMKEVPAKPAVEPVIEVGSADRMIFASDSGSGDDIPGDAPVKPKRKSGG